MAITNYEQLISNLSYTEKDFQTIYPALLDLVKKETAKWDPSASNESDPGVLLLKLNAIIADKCNYNIDKNVLECFPLSVTQEENARQLFEQLGYYMYWYQAASTIVSLKYTGEDRTTDDDGNYYSFDIPKFTMVSDDENSVIYTIVDQKSLSTDGTIQSFTALQGIKTEYEINGVSLITTADLDSNNRLYFADSNVAENGIFITNNNASNYNSWKKKDNLLVEEVSSSNYFYKFGISQDLETCYLEFPENAEELFQDGINITYIKTDGASGDIAPYALTSFYTDLEVSDPASTDTTVTYALTTDNVTIKNYVNGFGGKNPEDINSAYTNYKKTVGTFQTLVTLRDYLNAIRNSEYISNAVVSDRTTDIQSAYSIIAESGAGNQPVSTVLYSETADTKGYYAQNNFWSNSEHTVIINPDTSLNYIDITPGTNYGTTYRVFFTNSGASYTYMACDPARKAEIEAFDLKLTLLTTTSLMENPSQFNLSFTLLSPENDEPTITAVKTEIDDYKCVQHNFIDLLENRICFIKNKYPLNCKIIPQYILTDTQKAEVAKNIRLALYDGLNANSVEFGSEINYDEVYQLILNADSRIKSVSLDLFTYTTYAVYLTKDSSDKQVVQEVDISEPIWMLDQTTNKKKLTDSIINEFRTEIYAKSVLAGKTQLFIKDSTFDYGINQKYQILKHNIGQFVSNVNIAFSNSNNWQYEVRPNETIQIFAPNLLDSDEFGENIRFEYYLRPENRPIAKDSSYMLGDNEYIIFYWTDDADLNAGFQYAIYGKGAIIKPSWALNKSVSQPTSLVGAELRSKCTSRTVNNQTYLYASGDTMNESSTLTENVTNMTDTDKVLSSSRSIVTQLQNSITITPSGYYCYWVLNETDQNEYVLFDATTSAAPRVLKSGEYFIYTGPTKTDMVILGEGTQVLRTGESTERLACKAIDFSLIEANGIDAIYSDLVQLSTRDQLQVTEMQYLAFGEDTVVSITPGSTVATRYPDQVAMENCVVEYYLGSTTEVAANTPYTLGTGEYIIFYWAEEDTSDGLYYNVYGAGTIISSLIKLDDPAASTSALVGKDFINNCIDITLGGRTYKFADGFTTDTTIINAVLELAEESGHTLGSSTAISILKTTSIASDITLNSSTTTNLYDYTIKYKESITSTTWETVPKIALKSTDFAWQGRALLRVNVSNAEPQVLRTNQSIKYYLYDSSTETLTEEGVINPGAIGSPFVDYTYLMTSRLVNSIGPTISTLEKNTSDVLEPLSIYAYVPGEFDSDIQTLSDGSTQVLFTYTDNKTLNKHVKFKLPAGDYIMPVSHDAASTIISTLKAYLSPYNLYTSTNDEGLPNLSDVCVYFKSTPTITTAQVGSYTKSFNVFTSRSYPVPTETGTWTVTVEGTEIEVPATISLNDETFSQYSSGAVADYVFTYDGTDWKNASGTTVTLSNLGITISPPEEYATQTITPATGNTITVRAVYTPETLVGTATGIKLENANSVQKITYLGYKADGTGTATDLVVYNSSSTPKWASWKYNQIHFDLSDDDTTTATVNLYDFLAANSDPLEKMLTTMGNDGTSNLYEAKHHYLKIDSLSDSDSMSFQVDLRLELTYNNTLLVYPTIPITIPPIFKYSNSTSLDDDDDLNADFFVRVYEKIRELDFNKIFNYTYVVDEDEEIKYPLTAASYLDVNHVYNPYTICQLNTATDALVVYVSNTIRS